MPELPVAPIGVVTRIGRLRARFDEELAGLFARYDLTSADFTVVAALRRAGAPYVLPQSVLMGQLGLTSGTVSVRLARLVKKGVVSREPSPHDARGALITLTARGLELFDEVAPAHLANEDLLLSALTDSERAHLFNLLRKLLVSFEQDATPFPHGFAVAPAHIARRMRQAVGLPDVPGLLVTEVTPRSPAGSAGLRPGDLLIAAAEAPVRSTVTLAEVVAESAGEVELTVLRGRSKQVVTVTCPD
jgi:DNA-binding MarR family transcriptional regulator